jgi:glycosyltransferase involved in cell wall biosynthesis
MGTPSLVSAEVPSVNDIGAPGPAPARIVDPYDIDDMADGLAAVLTDEPLRDDLTARGARLAGARTWQATAREHIALWRGLR